MWIPYIVSFGAFCEQSSGLRNMDIYEGLEIRESDFV